MSVVPVWLKKLLTVDDTILDKQFVLEGPSEANADGDEDAAKGAPDSRDVRHHRHSSDLHKAKEVLLESRISPHLDEVKSALEDLFHLPDNKDIVIRDFTIGTDQPVSACAVFVDGMADKTIINTHILQPLMLLTHLTDDGVKGRIEPIMEALLPGNQITMEKTWETAVAGILSGSTAVFVDGCEATLVVETKGWEHRSVGVTQTEAVVRGPHDAFTESLRANTGLVRARLRSRQLVTEMITVGKLGSTDVAVMYIEGLTNADLVAEVKKRIHDIDVDYLADSGLMEQFLEDHPRALLPQVLSTERPDRIAHMLTEGHVAIFVGNSPYVLAVPVVFWTLVHTPEDAYLRFPFGTFLRGIRWLALIAALLLPAFYVAVSNFHPEMMPTDLMLAVAGSREAVPFPVIVEVLLMEFAIELIREAGIRIPSVIGPTIGIVGALILGQAAVQAGIVSPLLVIVVATTALAAFAIPSYSLSLGVRLTRFLFLLSAATFGFYGMTLVLCVVVAMLSVRKSFGVPFLSPVTPSQDSSPDVFIRGPAYTMNQRPTYLKTGKSWRQQPITRPWSKQTRPSYFKRRGRS